MADDVRLAEAPASDVQAAEAFSLASEMSRAYAAMVQYYRKRYGMTDAEADKKAQELLASPVTKENALTLSPDQVDWWNLGALTGEKPEQAVIAWARLKAEARAELATGHRIAKAAAGWSDGPWGRAQFLAIRQSMLEGWAPAPGVETALVDMLATAQHSYLFWLERLTTECTNDAEMEEADINNTGKWRPVRIAEAESVERSAAMVDRWNRIFLRTLRALRDLRRYSSPVHIENAGQVNIGEQQVNVATGVPSSPQVLADSSNK